MTKDVVKVKTDSESISRNYQLKEEDLYIDKVPVQHLPDQYISSIDQAVGKILKVDVTNGTILTSSFIDVDDLEPKPGEGIFAIPKDAIFGINGSLRRRDVVDIYAVLDTNVPGHDLIPEQEPILRNVTVAYVRSDDNNDVQDGEVGNERITSTGRVSYPEVILSHEQGQILKNKIEQGYLLWIVRVE